MSTKQRLNGLFDTAIKTAWTNRTQLVNCEIWREFKWPIIIPSLSPFVPPSRKNETFPANSFYPLLSPVWICKPSILGQFWCNPTEHPIWTDWPALASNKQWAKVPLHKLCPVFEKINWSTHPPRSLCADVCAGVEKGEGGFLVWEFPFKTDEQVVLYSDKYNIGGHRTHLKNNREAITVCFAFDHMFDNLKKKEKRESNMNTGIHNKLAVFKRVLWRNFSWLRSNYRNYYLVSKSHTMLSFTILCVNLGCWTKMLMIVCILEVLIW